MKLHIELLEDDKPVEVLVINGGAESVHCILNDPGDHCEVEVAVPQAVVIREAYKVS